MCKGTQLRINGRRRKVQCSNKLKRPGMKGLIKHAEEHVFYIIGTESY